MRVSVLINPKAGTVKESLIERKIREALFRCDLIFHLSKSFESMTDFITEEINKKTDHIIICGGDGTVNTSLQILMKSEVNSELPPICLIRSGTANDLAHEIGISERIDNAARLILEGKQKKIDVIEIISGNEKKYMLTNGGLGIPAETADKANKLRSLLQTLSSDQNNSDFSKLLSKYSYGLVKKMGSLVYIAMLIDTLRSWEQENWKLEIELPNKDKILSLAPFILVNNQPLLGKNFLTAPYTSNNDGLVNLLIIESKTKISQLYEIYKVYRERLKETDIVNSYEISNFTLTSLDSDRGITFFGDGEILFRDVNSLSVNCLKQKLSVMVQK